MKFNLIFCLLHFYDTFMEHYCIQFECDICFKKEKVLILALNACPLSVAYSPVLVFLRRQLAFTLKAQFPSKPQK